MSSENSRAPSKILIADDNLQNCELLDAYLSGEGYEIEIVGDGQQTLEAVERWRPDLILLDIMMPKLSGYEVCQRLKSDPETKKVPILMVTALAEMGDIEKAVNAGANDFLTKPVNKLELTTRVKTLLELRHVQGELDRLLAYMERVDGGIGEARNAERGARNGGRGSAERGARNAERGTGPGELGPGTRERGPGTNKLEPET